MFEELIAAVEPLRGLDCPWYVAGGWAIDLFAERVTREHSDVDLMVARSDQESVYSHFRDRALAKVIPHPDGLVGRGTIEPWGGERLDLPVHQVFADDAAGNRIEILLGEIEGDEWRYRRNPAVVRSIDEVALTSTQGIPFLAPEVVLLFKAKLMRPWDANDFETAAAVMGPERRSWLREALEQSHPGHEWIAALA